MSSALATLKSQIMALPESPAVTETTIAEIGGPQWGSFLPYIQVMTFLSAPVQAGAVKPGNLVLNDQSQISTFPDGREGEKPSVMVVCASRPKAVDMRNKEDVKILFNDKDPDFKDLYQIAHQSGPGLKNVLCGIEFLVWLPALKRFATFFFYNKTLLTVSEKMTKSRGTAIAVNVRAIESQGNKWHGIVIDDQWSEDLEAVPQEGALEKALKEFSVSQGQTV